MEIECPESGEMISVRLFSDENKELTEAPIVLPRDFAHSALERMCIDLLEINDDPVPLSFRSRDGIYLRESIKDCLSDAFASQEKALELIYSPEALFRVYPVTRCTSSMPGHGEPVISVRFSPDAKGLASGSGDATVRLWDLNTQLPLYTCKGHRNWVLCVSWSPDGKKIASACKDGDILLWDPSNGSQIGKKMSGHKNWINELAWEPMNKDVKCRHLASAGKDGVIRIWDTIRYLLIRSLTSHTASVTAIRWGGLGLLYSASQDRTIKVWRTEDGVLCRTLEKHAHWVNTLALNVDYVLRTSCFDPNNNCIKPESEDKCQEVATKRYQQVLKSANEEVLVSGSDDFTMCLWHPSKNKKPIARLTGHYQTIIQVVFSPDAKLIASASFDKSIKLWCGHTGRFLHTFLGHVQGVYQLAWSADSRLIVSGSADSTLKVWNTRKLNLSVDLPGHGDEVYAVDWSIDGERVASGGKDKVLRLWRS